MTERGKIVKALIHSSDTYGMPAIFKALGNTNMNQVQPCFKAKYNPCVRK